jgi:hypothetical protein
MTVGIITINIGVELRNGGWSRGVWNTNKADLQLNGILNLWDGNPVYVDALTGTGSIALSTQYGAGPATACRNGRR